METYKLYVYCTNCDFRGQIDIEKGIKYEEKECPQCGVAGLIKDIPPENRGPSAVRNYY